jgi:hypothetical protein
MTGTHNIQFSQVQVEYLKAYERKYLDEMYRICADLAAIYIQKYARGRNLRLDTAELAHDSAAYLIGRYIENPGFKLEPLSGYLFRCCNGVMWRDKEWNRRKVSFEDWMRVTGEEI